MFVAAVALTAGTLFAAVSVTALNFEIAATVGLEAPEV